MSSNFGEVETKLLAELRALRKAQRRLRSHTTPSKLTAGQRISDLVAATIGSWRFILIQTVMLFIWIGLNITAYIYHWDPYPFILLNLVLSFQAAYAGPFIMMSQNRLETIDRRKAENDYRINEKAELEIELLHQKIDEMRESEMQSLAKAILDLTELMKSREQKG